MRSRRTTSPGGFELLMIIAGLAALASSAISRYLPLVIISLAVAAGLFGLALLGYWHWYNLVRRRRLKAVKFEHIDRMTGLAFEVYIAELLRQLGYKRVVVTKASGDYGADVLARKGNDKYSIQVKLYGPDRKVNLKAVQEAHAAANHYGCNRSMVITNREFETSARVLATATMTELVDREGLGKWLLELQRK